METSSGKTLEESILNAFSIDVEGLVESNMQSFHIPNEYVNQSEENLEIERNTNALLEILGELNIKATFFFVGRLTRDTPSLIKKVSQAGHEIGCHNYLHLRVFNIEQNEFKEKLAAAKKELEDISGQPVYGFRAPDFSITSKSIWVLDILKQVGFVYDSSIYPFGLHDVYGIKDADSYIHKLSNGLIEFPMSTAKLFGKRIPFGGGGYFRFYPLWLTKFLFSKLNMQGQPVMFYIHPYEVGPVIPRIPNLSPYRRIRHYYRCSNGENRLKKLLKAFKFATAIDVLRQTGLVQDGPCQRVSN